MDIARFEQLPLLGILRGIDDTMIEPLVDIMDASGLQSVEITMNTVGAPALIKQMQQCSNGRLMIGAGTVLSLEEMHQALDAGASFIVMPTLVEPVSSYCAAHGIPFFPGAMTPNEIKKAWDLGATYVKVFPSSMFSPSYFKEIKGPFNSIKLMACGGVTPVNLAEFFANKADAISFGGSAFNLTYLKNKEYDKVLATIKAFVDNYTLLNKW